MDGRAAQGLTESAMVTPRRRLVYTLPMRSLFFAVLLTMGASAAFAEFKPPELVTVPAEAVVKIEGGDQARARESAMSLAFMTAARMAAASLVPEAEFELYKDLIERDIVSRGADFVQSYKFLQENVDNTSGSLKVRLQVTLFVDSLRNALRDAGAPLKRRDKPKLLIIIDEKSANLLASGNFLLLNSRSEEILSAFFRERGYQVADRATVRKTGLEAEAIAAVKRSDRGAIEKLWRAVGADMMLFGLMEVDARKTEDGEMVEAEITVSLFKAPGGVELIKRIETASGVYSDVLTGSLETTKTAAEAIAKGLALDVRSRWKEFEAGRTSDE